jgi:hypothetical protein
VVIKIKDVAFVDYTFWYYLCSDSGYRTHLSASRKFFFLSYYIAGNDVYTVYAWTEACGMDDAGKVYKARRISELA